MLRAVRWKFFLLFALTVVAILFVLPSFPVGLPDWWQKHVSKGLNLGLDLKGGMHLVLEVDMDSAISNALNRALPELKEMAEKKGLAVKVGEVSKEALTLTLLNADEQSPLQSLLKEEFPQMEVQGPRRQDGALLYTLSLKPDELKRLREQTLNQSLEVLRNRIDQFGVTEPVILRQGSTQIVVQLPGIQDPQRALDLIGKTAQLEFKLVDDQTSLNLPELIDKALQDGRLKPGYSPEDLNRALADKIPPDDEVYFEKRVNRETGRIERTPMLLKKKVEITGADIKDAKSRPDDYNRYAVHFEFNSRGAKEFSQITGKNIGRHLAIILDDVVQSAPVIQSRIGASGVITGSFTPQEAHDLSIVLRAGALPATVKIVQNITVGPTLGADSIHKGWVSGLLGTLLVVAFMLFYYRFSGVVANYALILNVIMLLGALSLLNATLTLPGIAGIILSIGMAVDSNVLIYERMREEFHAGKPLKSGVDGGYDKAFWTIIDAHVTTLITACALFLFGTGPIKGFAVTLSLGVTLNLFTALFGTRVVYDWLILKRWLKKLSFFELFQKPNIDFIGFRRYAFAVSGILSILGLIAFVQLSRGYGNLGVEFSSGAMVQLSAKETFTVEGVRQALNKEGWGHAEIQPVEGGRGLMIKVKKSEESVGQMANKLAAILNQSLTQNRFTVASTAEIGASISYDLRNKAIIAIVISMVGIIIYLAWRFELIFGIGAAVATFHDVLAVLGIFWLMHKEITLLVVTALLTLAGYSLTDTVVVFDRIRENLARRRGKMGDIINLSVNEVLSRTIVTSTTVFLVVVALYFFGGVVLEDFALAMILGVLVGTYSSVFVASPIVYAFRKESKRVAVKKEKVIELTAAKQKSEEKKEKKAPKAATWRKKGGKK
ncbi:MAG: preprotein translocase subunit SecF [Deltaproteobacteria bacterium RBG_13_60_28]|nr:MAG: preprotein translocase subunit SecF [Deltaproteobacteria bacterium RBG_13_60_28]